ncbi:MAG: NAD(P)/FAD-dependent oxidoreductase [bacterium]|nr:MAG: NAD(P)/FAD-dependent oxidoreductase [bacterium]
MWKFDVIIIGGGPSGAMSGIELQKRGIKTCIIDKSTFPREKLCGGLLTQKSVDLIKKYCPDIKHEDFIVENTHKVDFYHKGQKVTTFKTDMSYSFTERKIFDFLLIQNYKRLGGTLFENKRIRKDNIDLENNTIQIDTETFNYKVLIGADGCNSILTKKKQIKRFDSFCLEGELKKENIEEKEFSIYFGRVKNGYGWYFPKKDYYSVGIGGDNSNKSLKKQAELFFEKISSGSISNIKGAFIPSGRLFNYEKFNNNTLVVGDAAGYTDPITGEGLYYALLSGVYAAETTIETIQLNSLNFKKTYLKKTRFIRKNIKYALFLQKILYCPLVLSLFMRFIKNHKSFVLFYLENVMSTNKYNYINFIGLYWLNYILRYRGKILLLCKKSF